MSEHLKEQFERILESCRTKELWDNSDRESLRAFLKKLGPPTKVAQIANVSVSTLHWWGKKQSGAGRMRRPPPVEKIKVLRDLVMEHYLEDMTTSAPTPTATEESLYDLRLPARPLSYVLDKFRFCESVWLAKSGIEFMASIDQTTLDSTMSMLLDNKELTVHFIYTDPEEELEVEGRNKGPKSELESLGWQAKDSYNLLTAQLEILSDWSSIKDRVIGVPIKSANVAYRFGLVDPWVGYVLAEYTKAGQAKFRRSVDVWMMYSIEVNKGMNSSSNRIAWLELSPEKAREWRERRRWFWKQPSKS